MINLIICKSCNTYNADVILVAVLPKMIYISLLATQYLAVFPQPCRSRKRCLVNKIICFSKRIFSSHDHLKRHEMIVMSSLVACFLVIIGGCRGRDRMVVGFTTTFLQSVSITTEVVSLNPTQAR